MCVQEEGRSTMEEGENVNITTRGKKKKYQAKDKGKGKVPPQKDIKKEQKCFFCKKKGHMKECSKFFNQLDKKGSQLSLVCYESNMTDVNHNTRWIDSSSTIHVTNLL